MKVPPLTPRELQVLRMVASGHCNKEIADKLGISTKTVEKHRNTMNKKIATPFELTACGVVAKAFRMGLIT